MNPIDEVITSICTFFEDLCEVMCKPLRRAILGKTWYEDMDFDDLAEIHVRTKWCNGTFVEGKLRIWDNSAYAIDNIPVLIQKSLGIDKAPCIEYVNYLWDEKDYEQIDWENIREGDYVLCNETLMMVDSIVEDTVKVNMNDDLPDIEIPKKLVLEVLRLKQDIPTDPGIYKSDHCLYLILDSRKQWIVVQDDYTVNTYKYDELPVRYRDNIKK